MSDDARQTFVVVGGGLAAGKAVGTLRDEGFAGRIVLFGNEPHLPYERPPLSKGYLMGTEQVPYVHHPGVVRRPRRRPPPRGHRHLGRPGAHGRSPPGPTSSRTTRCSWPPARAPVPCRWPTTAAPPSTTCARSRTPTGSARC